MKIAACAFAPDWAADWEAVTRRMDQTVGEAAGAGADLLVFPEYAGCAAALTGGPEGAPSAEDWARRMADRAGDWRELHASLARKHGVWIVAGSLCAKAEGGLVNRAYLSGPDGELGWQDKIILTPYERDEMKLTGGQGLRVFDTPLGRLGILICYDSEFPLLARAMVEAGVDMILVPSATDYAAGQTRVRQSCRARAIEGQCLVVQAPVLGGIAGCDVLDCGTGRVGVFAPPDYGLPSDGIIAQGQTDQPGWVFADIDPAAISAARITGQVANYAHWPEQQGHMAELTRLTVD